MTRKMVCLRYEECFASEISGVTSTRNHANIWLIKHKSIQSSHPVCRNFTNQAMGSQHFLILLDRTSSRSSFSIGWHYTKRPGTPGQEYRVEHRPSKIFPSHSFHLFLNSSTHLDQTRPHTCCIDYQIWASLSLINAYLRFLQTNH